MNLLINSSYLQTEEDLAPEQITERQQQPILIPLPEPDSINETEPEEAIEQNEQNINGGQQETLFVEEATTEAAAIPTTKPTPIAPTRGKQLGQLACFRLRSPIEAILFLI